MTLAVHCYYNKTAERVNKLQQGAVNEQSVNLILEFTRINFEIIFIIVTYLQGFTLKVQC